MFKRFLLLVIAIPTLIGFTGSIVACDWDINPEVLLITSYENAQEQATEDRLVYQKLEKVYGDRAITAIFSHQDDNLYANVLQNLIIRFNLKKVFILDPSFNYYLPKSSSDTLVNSSLVRVLQQFTNVDFYFFNNQIADTIKVTNNIYEFRFDVANKREPMPSATYGALLADHFYNQLVDSSGNVDVTRYNFDIDKTDAKFIVRIGLINNIGDEFQQQVITDFWRELSSKTPLNAKYQFKSFKLNISNTYTSDNVRIVEEAASLLYQYDHVNFIFNSNDWYNNAIAHAAINTSSLPEYTKTMQFVATSVTNKDAFKYQNKNYMMFSYDLDFAILDYTIGEKIPDGYQVLDDAPENMHAYGLNSKLNFVDTV